MGVADRDYEYKQSFRKKRFTLGESGNALLAVVAINIVFFLLIMICNLFFLYSHQGQGMEALSFNAVHWFALPASFTGIAYKPWTILSFMFSHGVITEPLSLLLNMLSSMLWLWVFGFIFQDLSGNKYIFPVYIYGSLAGAVVFIITAYAVPAARANLPVYILTGSGMGTMAIAAALTTINHDYRIFRNIRNGMPIWILTAVYFVINVLDIFSPAAPYCVAYLGAALAGFLFVYYLKRGTDLGQWMSDFYEWASNLFDPAKKTGQAPLRQRIFYDMGHREPYTKTAVVTQKRVDEILDKINQHGYDYLTEEEKNVLKKASEEDSF